MKSYILCIDQGTTGSTALLLDAKGKVECSYNQEFPVYFPKNGWVEQNPDEIIASVHQAVEGLFQKNKISMSQILGIGITNQRETIVAWDRVSGKALCNAIVWQCRRTTDLCQKLKDQGWEKTIHRKTGLFLDPYFSASKMQWMLQHVEAVRDAQRKGNLCMGTIDSYVLFVLTGKQVFATDVSNASRTMLMNVGSLAWDDELLECFGVSRSVLPMIVENTGILGETHSFGSLPDGIPIAGMAGDQQAALFGQRCFSAGQLKCTYGTGAFLLLNTGEDIKFSEHQLLTTVAWKIQGKTNYALEGSVFNAGAAVQWLRDGMGWIEQSSEVENLALQVDDSHGVVVVPAFTGLGAPHWNPHARGMILGMDRATTKAHIARATLEGIAFQVQDLVEAMEKDFQQELKEIRVDGGASQNNLLMQFQSDIGDISLQRPRFVESTAIGAGLLAGLSLGFWKDQKQLEALYDPDETFSPHLSSSQREEKYHLWKRALKACNG
ncbi:MAG: glycerol kinase GlpK [Bdellovibrionota bacterium]